MYKIAIQIRSKGRTKIEISRIRLCSGEVCLFLTMSVNVRQCVFGILYFCKKKLDILHVTCIRLAESQNF